MSTLSLVLFKSQSIRFTKSNPSAIQAVYSYSVNSLKRKHLVLHLNKYTSQVNRRYMTLRILLKDKRVFHREMMEEKEQWIISRHHGDERVDFYGSKEDLLVKRLKQKQ